MCILLCTQQRASFPLDGAASSHLGYIPLRKEVMSAGEGTSSVTKPTLPGRSRVTLPLGRSIVAPCIPYQSTHHAHLR